MRGSTLLESAQRRRQELPSRVRPRDDAGKLGDVLEDERDWRGVATDHGDEHRLRLIADLLNAHQAATVGQVVE
jgi:hypothetical protein